MRHYTGGATAGEFPRIVTVGMGTLGRMVVRQVLRTLRHAECVLLEDRDEIAHDFPALGQKVRGADCVFIVIDPLDGEALNTANWLAWRMMAERALVAILSGEPAEPADSGMLSGYYPFAGEHTCPCIVVSPLCINPLPDEAVAMFGREMLATYLIRYVIEIVARWMSEHSIPCIDFVDIKEVLGGGGIVRLGIGMNTNGNVGDAVQKAVESLARQGVELPRCRAVLGCLSGSTNLKINDFDTVCKEVHKCLDYEAVNVVGILTDDTLGRTVKVTLFIEGTFIEKSSDFLQKMHAPYRCP